MIRYFQEHQRLFRAAAWAWFLVVAAAVLGFAAWGAQSASARLLSDAICYLAPIAICAAVALVLAFSTRGSMEYRFWAQVFVALVLTGAAESYWTWYATSVDPTGPATSSPVLLLYYAAGLVFISIAVTMGRAVQAPVSSKARTLLDIFAGALVVFPLIYLLWTLPLFNRAGEGWDTAAVAASYPIFGVLLLGVTLSVIIGWRARHWRGWERLLAGTLIALALVLSTWPLWYADQVRPGGRFHSSRSLPLDLRVRSSRGSTR